VAARAMLCGGSPEPMAVLDGTIPSGTATSSAFAVQSTDRALMVGVSVRGTRLAPKGRRGVAAGGADGPVGPLVGGSLPTV